MVSKGKWILLVMVLYGSGVIYWLPPAAEATVPENVVTSTVVIQAYERGHMIWREDTEEIYVLVGVDQGRFRHFPLDVYEFWAENPVWEATPAGLVRPAYGFGRVWGHEGAVRDDLGWATSPEISYQAEIDEVILTASGIRQLQITLDDGEMILLSGTGEWTFKVDSRAGALPTLPERMRFPAAWQSFEGGVMMYWHETGDIFVIYHDGTFDQYPAVSYGRLSNYYEAAIAPAGYVTPVLGFGKVWHYFPEVRAGLGWGERGEQTYVMNFERVSRVGTVAGSRFGFKVSAIGGYELILWDSGYWQVVE